MEVFHCEVPSNQIVPFYSGPGQSEGKPKELEACRKVIGAWAMGATVSKVDSMGTVCRLGARP
ncbi:hypothetical protein DPMN_151679 [Dreissena polymorpha]|uniref:Copper type II ascorbate-dependent monooxygenase N-terminal domain-containing protein n=1 Tax=Dreissena polymorpha TaxID=45954 RepID=A0A9D4FI48_DREPO|nr:hypothetical protein DPMN_151679 [Dreissena polymorpha]